MVMFMSRISKYEEWKKNDEISDKLILVEGWSRDGLSQQQIANNLGINVDTLIEYKKKYSDFSQALKKGREIVDYEVENALYKTAMGYTITLHKQKVTKDGDVVDIEEEVHVPPNPTAQIFWLKNRQKEKWREKQEVSVNANPIEDLTPLAELLNGEKK